MNNIYLIKNNNTINIDLTKNSNIILEKIKEGFNIQNEEFKNKISELEYTKYPLYDINNDEIFLIDKENIYKRIINENYRFPDLFIYEYLKKKNNNYAEELGLIENDEDTNIIISKMNNIKDCIRFLENFDLDKMKNTFIKFYDNLGISKYKELTTCIRPSYTNILPNTYYIKPYYSLIELKKNSIIYENENDKDDELDLCEKSVIRDIDYKKLIRHQKHIIENNGGGILQFYSLIGSYIINNYLRGLNKESIYKNKILDKIIEKFWNIIITSPSFDKEFYIYRFINNDSFLENLEIGDIYKDKGFLSCTRDPYYTSKYFSFGENLMKIKVPKNKIGFGLCLELFSHFGREQEILLAPNTGLKLLKKDSNVKYEHTNIDISIKLKRKYEFEIVSISDYIEEKKEEIETKKVDKLYNMTNNKDIYELFEELKEKYLNEIYQVEIKIGNKYYPLIVDKIKTSPVYLAKAYYIESEEEPTEEIVIYYIENNEIIFFIEIGYNKEDERNEIFVNLNNYYNYINQRIEDIFKLDDFFKFLKNIGEYFGVTEIVLSCDFISCEYFRDQRKLHKVIEDYRDILGGNFNFEIYVYFTEKKIRFSEYIKKEIIFPLFDFRRLDKYEKMDMNDIINLSNSYEIKEVLKSLEKKNNNKITVKDFYLYLSDYKCFLVSELSYIIALNEYNKNKEEAEENIFYNPFYVFDITKFKT